MLKQNLAILTLLSVAAGPLMAQETSVDPASREALEQMLTEMPGADTVRDVVYYDMSRNGYEEALVTMDQNCDQEYCDWKLFAVGDEGWRAVGGGSGHFVHFEPTEDNGAVLNTDDITWAYSGGSTIYMYGDLLQGVAPTEASNEEYDLVAANLKYTETARMRLDRYEVDLNGDNVPERVYMIGGLFYKAGQWGTPYMIFDANDNLVLQGISTDMPRIFPMSEKPGSIVANVTPAGLQTVEIN